MYGIASTGALGGAAVLLASVLACSTPLDTEVGVYVPLAGPETGTSVGGGLATGEPPAMAAGGAPAESGAPSAGGTGAGGREGNIPPEDVHFEWTETQPTEGLCLPGVYSGVFQCQLSFNNLFPSSTVSGPVNFTLRESQNGEFLEVTDGEMAGLAGVVVFASELVGRLDCATNTFEAFSVNGMFTGGTFSGALQGTLDRTNQRLQGVWSMAVANAPNVPPCIGLWSVERVP